ncbi:autotransporter outer membrane beta-barrel domain-containing protein [Bradyrhizobium sp. DN5]|uniref:autotransporter outer membrane beta-barrel domain-containing protein n=1 Tax=Bradyrhizobium sp. DN5 TaxID=3056950 RepID=UPI0035238A1A
MRVATLQGSQTQALHFAMMAISSDATICHCNCWAAARFFTAHHEVYDANIEGTTLAPITMHAPSRSSLELGYKAHVSDHSLIEPYANLADVRSKTDGFSEKGWSGATLDIRTDTMETTLSTVGIRTTNNLQLGHVTSTARTDLGWRNAFGDYIPPSTGSFAGARPSIISACATARLQFGSGPFPI